MINVKVHRDNITVSGHADAGPIGHDLVCAAVSVLVYTLIISVTTLTDDKCYYNIESGYCSISVSEINRSEKTQTIIDSFICGIESLVENYPDNVVLEEHRFS